MRAPAASSKFCFRPGARPRSAPRLRRAATPIPTYSYELRDGNRQTQISTVANIGSGGTSTSSFVYDKNGDLKTVNYATNNVAIHAVNFVTDSTDQVIARTDRNVGATTGPTDYYDRFGGQAMSQVGNDGTADFDDATAIARRSATPGNLYRNGGAQVINSHHKSSTFRSMTPTRCWATWPAQVNTSIPVAQRCMGLNRAFSGFALIRLPAWGEGGREADG